MTGWGIVSIIGIAIVSLSCSSGTAGSYYTGRYPNLFTELLGVDTMTVNAKIDSAFNRLFYGNDSTERIYYPVGSDMAYIYDTGSNDVRTEGMSYGLMIAVQLDRKTEFDRLWKWTKTFMLNSSGPQRSFFAWHCSTDGKKLDLNSASDGEEWFVTALLFASSRWGDSGTFNYLADARTILHAMLDKQSDPENDGSITPMFNKAEKQVVFVPTKEASAFTDPSYHLPHFYELWALRADRDNRFWKDAADTSRRFLKKAVHPVTGLAPDYAGFDGTPVASWGAGHADFRFDAWRVGMNVALDHLWFDRDEWAVEQSNRLLGFFRSEGIADYVNQYSLDGKRLGADHSAGLVAMNAAACLASNRPDRADFVRQLWDLPVPSGLYRYYDGMLYMMSLLQVSGNFRIYDPSVAHAE